VTRAHYFAFGSNMSSARLQARIPRARPIGRGYAEGWRFVCNKTGIDGSAKANMERADGARLWGVVYSVSRADLTRLDAFEGGYERVLLQVVTDDVMALECETYRSTRVTSDPTPFHWYKALMVEGAREFDLPGPYVAMLESLAARGSAALESPQDAR